MAKVALYQKLPDLSRVPDAENIKVQLVDREGEYGLDELFFMNMQLLIECNERIVSLYRADRVSENLETLIERVNRALQSNEEFFERCVNEEADGPYGERCGLAAYNTLSMMRDSLLWVAQSPCAQG